MGLAHRVQAHQEVSQIFEISQADEVHLRCYCLRQISRVNQRRGLRERSEKPLRGLWRQRDKLPQSGSVRLRNPEQCHVSPPIRIRPLFAQILRLQRLACQQKLVLNLSRSPLQGVARTLMNSIRPEPSAARLPCYWFKSLRLTLSPPRRRAPGSCGSLRRSAPCQCAGRAAWSG